MILTNANVQPFGLTLILISLPLIVVEQPILSIQSALTIILALKEMVTVSYVLLWLCHRPEQRTLYLVQNYIQESFQKKQ